ncbi:MAG: DinB family protein [Acidimicrobiia bacterium]|nr:DinB family protein [Acidimicrobiia bacterium]
MPEVSQLLLLIDEAFDHRSWHGTTLSGSLRGLAVPTACARPAAGRHNIWELIVHTAYWKYAVRQRLTGGKRGSFSAGGSNWFVRPVRRRRSDRSARGAATSALSKALAADIRLLVSEHRALREAVARFSDADLNQKVGQDTRAFLIRGIAAHDLYHAGQIQLIKRLVRRRCDALATSDRGLVPRAATRRTTRTRRRDEARARGVEGGRTPPFGGGLTYDTMHSRVDVQRYGPCRMANPLALRGRGSRVDSVARRRPGRRGVSDRVFVGPRAAPGWTDAPS